jgi:uncharacterized integral membrane protein
MGGRLSVAALLALLALVLWFIYREWISIEIDLPAWGWWALAFGVVLALAVGCGLMALLFYSDRMGYDDAAAAAKPVGTPDADEAPDSTARGPNRG